MQKSPGGHSRPGTLIVAAGKAKQMFPPQVLTTLQEVGSAAAFAGTAEVEYQGCAYGTAHLAVDPLSRP